MREIPSDCDAESRRLERLPGRSRPACVRSPALRELAILLGLLRRQRLREHGAPGRILAHGPEPQDSSRRDHDGRQLSFPQDGSARRDGRHDAPSDGEDCSSPGTRCSPTTTSARDTTCCLGTKGTIVHDETDRPRYIPQGKGAVLSEASTGTTGEYAEATDAHMQNFFDCVRSRKEPNCPFEIGFRSAIACQMAVRSYREGRTVTWDEKTEEIV